MVYLQKKKQNKNKLTDGEVISTRVECLYSYAKKPWSILLWVV